MCLCLKRHLRSWSCQILTAFLAATSPAPSPAQQFPGHGTANYNWGVPYGSNYNYGFMRYGQGGFGGAAGYPIMQPQSNPGIGTPVYGVNGQVSGGIYPGANPYVQEAAAQAMQTQRQMQAIEPRYDVRKKTSRTSQSKARQANTLRPLDKVLSSEAAIYGGRLIFNLRDRIVRSGARSGHPTRVTDPGSRRGDTSGRL